MSATRFEVGTKVVIFEYGAAVQEAVVVDATARTFYISSWPPYSRKTGKPVGRLGKRRFPNREVREQ